ncbi:MAG: cupin domain-containing protein [Spirochaetales bacterium]|nr:cupin domain-containing protein [Spirochaetales bacterium]MCF7938574.1 cupin domain-containing protein [Spirochaetales bacterium]
MPKAYRKQTTPLTVPTEDGKLIEEHFGLPSTQQEDISVARMVAPPGWSEPAQTPEFDEYIIMIRGRKQIDVEGKSLVLRSGETFLARRGTRVQYSNPFDEEAEYWSVCVPAFQVERVHRE